MESELKELEVKRWNAIKDINDVEYRLTELRKIVQPSYVREKLQGWVSRVLRLHEASQIMPDEDTTSRYLVYIPFNEWDDDMKNYEHGETINQTMLRLLKEGNLLTIFQSDHDMMHMGEYNLELWVNNEEYEELFPKTDEKPWFILCGIRIVKESYTQHGEYINPI